MKKILLALFVLLLVFALFGCNNDVNTDTGSENQPNDTDTQKEITENTFVVNKIHDRYFDKILPAPAYLLDDIEDTEGAYKIIKTYDEYASCVDKTTNISADLFENNCILIIREYGTDFNGVKSESFLSENKILRDEPGISFVFVGEPHLDYFYLIIPKNYIPKNTDSFGTIEIELNLEPTNDYYFETKHLDELFTSFENFEENNVFMFDNEADYLDFINHLGCNSLSYMINDESITLVFRYDIQESSPVKIFKDFYIDGSVVYLTLDMFGAASSEAEQNNVFFVEIPKEKLNTTELPENPIFQISINEYYD